MHYSSGTEIIVGGGIVLVEEGEDGSAYVSTTTEIFNIGTGHWRSGKCSDKEN